MPTLLQMPQGTVTAMWGSALIRSADGKMHALKVGDVVHRGDLVLTTQDGIVEIHDEAEPAKATAAAKPDDIDRVIASLDDGDKNAAPAAVLAGDGGGGLQPGLRVDRISESVNGAAALPSGGERGFERGEVLPTENGPQRQVNNAPVADLVAASGLEDSTLPVSLTGHDTDGVIVSVTVIGIPAGSSLLLGDGVTPVQAGQTLTAAQALDLHFRPGPDFAGDTSIVFSVTDDAGAVSAPVSAGIHVIAVNDPPVGVADNAITAEDTPLSGNVLSNDRDADADSLSVTGFSIAGKPGTFAAGTTATLAGVGTLTIEADGSYRFSPAHDANGAVPVATYTLTDGTLTSTATLTLGVTAVNDAPIGGSDLASTPINTAIDIAVLANDSDPEADALTVADPVLANPAQGTISVNADGTLHFTPATDVTGPVDISYTVSDGHGGSVGASLTVNVGANTPPTGSDTERSVAEDHAYTIATADLGFADADAGQSLSNVRIDTLPANGSLELDGVTVAAGQVISAAEVAAGHLVFTPAADANGAPYASFGFSVQDSAGAFASSSSTFTLDVSPVDDAPVIGGDTTGSAIEDGLAATSGQLTIVDADAGDAAFIAASTGGSFGTLTVGADGHWNYVLDNADPKVQALGHGVQVTDTFTVTSVDGTARSIVIDITGTNDGAMIGTPSASAVTEDMAVDSGGRLSASGWIPVSDADSGEARFSSTVTSAAGNLGSLVLAPDGAYVYSVPDSDTQWLGDGQSKVDSFTVASLDGTTRTVAFTIHGVNDAAVIGTPLVSTVTEDNAVDGAGLLTASGSISISDVDTGESAFSSGVSGAAGNLGALVLASNGAYVYSVANSATQFLGDGQSKVDTFTVASVDGTVKTVEFTILGVNDAAVIGTPSVSSVTEDTDVDGAGNLTAAGSISISDADPGQANFSTTVSGATANLGSLVLASNGSYTYSVANSATQSLGDGQTHVDSFTVASADGTTKIVSFTIHGINDAAVIGTPSVSTVTEDSAVDGAGNLVAAGSISVSDVDAGEATFSTTVSAAAGNLGALVLASNGSYTYSVANSATQFLGDGQTHVDSFTVASVDGTTKTVSFTIHGVNDAAVIGTPTVSAVTEDSAVDGSGNLVAAGSISISDADAGQGNFSTTVSGAAGNLGALVLASNGAYTYSVANSATQSLGNGQTHVDSFSVTSVDGTTQTVSFTINGVNDAAVIGTPLVSAVTEDMSVDGSGNLSLAGSLSISDVDAAQAAFATTVTGAAGNLGALVLASNGAYTYSVANSATQFLGDGQTHVDSFSVASVDGTTKTVAFTIHGVNDAAVIGTPSVSAVTEDSAVDGSGNLVATGSIPISDADTGQATFSTTVTAVAGNLGALVLASNGAYTYSVANSDTQYLSNGQTKVDSFTVTSVDGTTRTVSFTINGTDDAPVVGAASVRVSEEGLAGGLADSTGATDTTNATTASGTIALADVSNAALTVTLGAPATALTSGGTAVTWQSSNGGHTLTGSAGGVTILTATIDNLGHYTVTLSGPVDHADTSAEDVKSFDIAVNVSNGNVSSTGLLTVGIEDDSPVIGTPANAILFNGTGTSLVGDLHLASGADLASGAKVVFAGTGVDAGGFITCVRSGASGVSSNGYLTYNGSKLHYVSAANGALLAVDDNGTSVYTVGADPATGRYAVTMLHALDAVQLTTATFGNVTAGNNGVYSFSDGTNTFDLAASGLAANGTASTVNTNANVFGVANNFVDAGEKLTFAVSAHGSGNATQVTAMSVVAQGLGTGEALTWTAFDAAHNQVGQGVVNGSGNSSTNNVAINLGATDFAGGSFSSIEFGASGASASYKLQLNSITGNSESLNQVTSVAVHGTDSDGDSTATQAMSLTFNAYTALTGTTSEDALAGGSGNDTVNGGTGNDIVLGGAGNDSLTGGSGADVFVWHLADKGSTGTPAVDTITDFNVAAPASGGDLLEIRDLLQGENTGNLERFLDFDTTSAPGSTIIHVSTSGAFPTGSAWTAGQAASEDQRIVLQGVDLRSAFGLGVGASDNQIIQELLTRGKLVTDPS
jgi:VCBS repeat-containing protein